LRWIAVLYETNFNIKFELIAYILVVKPIRKRRFCINYLFHFFSKNFTFIIYNHTTNFFILAIFKIILVS